MRIISWQSRPPQHKVEARIIKDEKYFSPGIATEWAIMGYFMQVQ
jgi:hypothetical protein